MVGLCDSFLLAQPQQSIPHLWIIITSPCPTTNEVIMVNVTDQLGHSDNTTVLAIGEHPFITKASVINNGDSQTPTAANLNKAITMGLASPHRQCSQALLAKIQNGLLASPHTKPKIKAAFQRAQTEGRDKPPGQKPAPPIP